MKEWKWLSKKSKAETLSSSASSSTSIIVQVQNGAIVANINGGGNRLIVQDVTLDALMKILVLM